jgi:hypothetical protein
MQEAEHCLLASQGNEEVEKQDLAVCFLLFCCRDTCKVLYLAVTELVSSICRVFLTGLPSAPVEVQNEAEPTKGWGVLDASAYNKPWQVGKGFIVVKLV